MEVNFTSSPPRWILVLLVGFVSIIILLSPHELHAQPKVIKIYHDSDYSSHKKSAASMSRGFNTALSEVNFMVQGFRIELIPKDHRGNSVRSKLNMEKFLKDKEALLILGGLHSPPYIKYREFINQNQILMLVPWAAGGPVTRYDGGVNWVFRLSIDDTNAGFKLVSHAVESQGCKNPHLLLEDTPWGKSNLRTMTSALKNSKVKADSTLFNWNTKSNLAKRLIREKISKQADCIIFVGNAIEGKTFTTALHDVDKDSSIKFISHWGIAGGTFESTVSHEIREKVSLQFIQTCFSFNSGETKPLAEAVLAKAKTLYPEIKKPEDILAPTGFIHAYDLGKLLLQALEQVTLSDNMAENRKRLQVALENIKEPVAGLVKTYEKPFTSWSAENPDAHEALGLNDYCMGKFDKNNHIRLLE